MITVQTEGHTWALISGAGVKPRRVRCQEFDLAVGKTLLGFVYGNGAWTVRVLKAEHAVSATPSGHIGLVVNVLAPDGAKAHVHRRE